MREIGEIGKHYVEVGERELEPMILAASEALGVDRTKVEGFLAEAWLAGAGAAAHDESIAEAARLGKTIKDSIEQHAPKPG
jgi:hypothetical protein